MADLRCDAALLRAKDPRPVPIVSLPPPPMPPNSEPRMPNTTCNRMRPPPPLAAAQSAAQTTTDNATTDQEGQGHILFLGRQAADHVARWLDAAPADGDAPLFRHIWKNGRVRRCGLASNTVYKIARKRRGSRRNFWTQRTFGAGGHGAVPHRLRRRHRRGCHRGTLEVRGSGHPLRQPPKGGAKRGRQISPKPSIGWQVARGMWRAPPVPLFPEPP